MSHVVAEWVGGLFVTAPVWAYAAARLAWRRRRVFSIRSTNRCRECAYDLAGLAEGARCPECGIEEPERLTLCTSVQAEYRWSRARGLVPLIPLALAIPVLVPVVWYAAWRWDGWSFDIASRFTFWSEGASNDCVPQSMAAMAIALPLVPAYIRGRRRPVRRWGVLGAYAGALAGLIIGTTVRWNSGAFVASGSTGVAASVGALIGAVATAHARIVVARLRGRSRL